MELNLRANCRNSSSPNPKPYSPLTSRSRSMSATMSNQRLPSACSFARLCAAALRPAAESSPVSGSRSGTAGSGSSRLPSSAISLATAPPRITAEQASAPAERASWRSGRTMARYCQRPAMALPTTTTRDSATSRSSVLSEPVLSNPDATVAAWAAARNAMANGPLTRPQATELRRSPEMRCRKVGTYDWTVVRSDARELFDL